MWRRIVVPKPHLRVATGALSRRCHSTRSLIDIQKGTFYRDHPSAQPHETTNLPLFQNLTFNLPNGLTIESAPAERQYWAVVSHSSVARTIFLQVLAGQHICVPPTARRYPFLSDIGTSAQHAVKYVGFDAERGSSVGGAHVRGAYLSARYESRREETDFTLRDYLLGNTDLNPAEKEDGTNDDAALEEIVTLLSLTHLLSMPVANLSNGQTRRARIAKALMDRPEVLLLDGPFMGLDPNTLVTLSGVLKQLAKNNQPRLLISLRPGDGVPDWINRLVVVDDQLRITNQGNKISVLQDSGLSDKSPASSNEDSKRLSRDGFPKKSPPLTTGERLVEMNGVSVSYGNKTVLGDWQQEVDGETKPGLWWTLKRGQRCGIFGANGSGKTTMLSLITSDHPQTYSLPIKLFGRSRLPGPGQPGISLFDIQKRMGHSSPEVHAFFPKHLTVRRTLESAWADAPMAKPALNGDARQRVVACLRWFANELRSTRDASKEATAVAVAADQTTDDSDIAWAKKMRFGELSFSNQRLALFLRAIVASSDLVILDEAFSGMDEVVRDKALLFLSHGETVSNVSGAAAEQSELSNRGTTTFSGLSSEQALLVISHAKEDVPGCVREWICLPEPGEGWLPRTGSLSGPLELNERGWDEIWGKR